MIEHEVGSAEEAHEAPSGAEATILDPDIDSDGKKLGTLPGGAGTPSLYEDFIASSKELEDKLQDFSQKVLKLGSGHELYKSSLEVKKGLIYMHSCFAMEEPEPVKRKKHNRPLGPGGNLAQIRETNRTVSLKNLSRVLELFSVALTGFDDYYEQKTDQAISGFRTEILILAEALSYFKIGNEPDGYQDAPELTEFINSHLSTAREQFNRAKDALLRFIDTGIPCIESAQERSSRMMLNASTVAIFFAGVAATTLQYAGIEFETTIGRAIQTLWFSSLVLSIGSAVTSLLVFAWRQAVFSRAQSKLPLYIRFWLRSGYLVLLSASIIAFISGLIAYVYALQRTRAMFWVVTISTAFCAISLADVLRWFAADQWTFWKSKQARALVRKLNPEKQSRAIWKQLKNFCLLKCNSVRHFYLRTIRGSRTTRDARPSLLGFIKAVTCFRSRRTHVDDAVGSDLESGIGQSGTTKGPHAADHQNKIDVDGYITLIQSLSPRGLSRNERAQIYDMQFSPDGTRLVVCTTIWCYVIDVKPESYQDLQFLFCLVRQVKWSPDGKRLLTRTGDDIHIWRVQGDSTLKFENRIRPGKSLVDVEWINNEIFVALSNDAESLFTVHVNIENTVEIRLLPSNLTIYEMTPVDPELILFLATRNVKGFSKGKGISCIIVYDMGKYTFQSTREPEPTLEKSGTIRSKVPLLKKAKGLYAGADRTRLIITYERSLPEVWSIDGSGSISMKCRLSVPQPRPKSVWGSASFVGHGENFIACAEDGVVHFWRDTTGDFEFQHFYSLPILDGGKSESSEVEQDDDSDNSTVDYTDESGDSDDESGDSDNESGDSDDDDDDDDVDDDGEAVFSWTLNSGSPTMASGYLGHLRAWSPEKIQGEKIPDTEKDCGSKSDMKRAPTESDAPQASG